MKLLLKQTQYNQIFISMLDFETMHFYFEIICMRTATQSSYPLMHALMSFLSFSTLFGPLTCMHAACYFTSLFGAYMQHVTLNKISRNVFYQEKEAVPMVYNTAGRKLATSKNITEPS